jgi:hypothetical protein
LSVFTPLHYTHFPGGCQCLNIQLSMCRKSHYFMSLQKSSNNTFDPTIRVIGPDSVVNLFDDEAGVRMLD